MLKATRETNAMKENPATIEIYNNSRKPCAKLNKGFIHWDDFLSKVNPYIAAKCGILGGEDGRM